MILELVLFTVWLCGSVAITIAAFYVGRFFARKIEDFFDKRRK